MFAAFDYQGMRDGMPWTIRWSVNGEVVISDDEEWEDGPDGSYCCLSLSHPNGLGPATYTLELLVQGQRVQTGSFTVAAGGAQPAQPTPSAAPTQSPVKPGQPGFPVQPSTVGVVFKGTIVDADTQRPIPGVLVVVLKPGVTIAQFRAQNYSDTLVAAFGTSDQTGAFATAPGLQRPGAFSVMVGHEDYVVREFEEGLTLAATGPDVIQSDQPIALRKR